MTTANTGVKADLSPIYVQQLWVEISGEVAVKTEHMKKELVEEDKMDKRRGVNSRFSVVRVSGETGQSVFEFVQDVYQQSDRV